MLTPQNKDLQFFRKSEAKKAYQPWSFKDYTDNKGKNSVALIGNLLNELGKAIRDSN